MDAETITRWSEFGLAGIVIGALFFALFIIIKWLINHVERISERHSQERREWDAAVSQLNETIKDLIDDHHCND